MKSSTKYVIAGGILLLLALVSAYSIGHSIKEKRDQATESRFNNLESSVDALNVNKMDISSYLDDRNGILAYIDKQDMAKKVEVSAQPSKQASCIKVQAVGSNTFILECNELQ